jgi:tRNA (cytidine56-2'-O)-methyltransferase
VGSNPTGPEINYQTSYFWVVMAVIVLRYGHRPFRDQRATTHVILAARALGADKVVFCGERDNQLISRINSIINEYGGDFSVEYIEQWIEYIQKFRENGGYLVHLTMYGELIQEKIEDIKNRKGNCLVFVGSQKVPPEAYKLADFNIAVTNQPHSEIAALAIFLDRYFEGGELAKKWSKSPNRQI